jgi:hypothetical protein
VRVPFFPARALLITSLDNLAIYEQEETRRRQLKEESEYNRVANYESANVAYVVEDYGKAALVENIVLAPSLPDVPDQGGALRAPFLPGAGLLPIVAGPRRAGFYPPENPAHVACPPPPRNPPRQPGRCRRQAAGRRGAAPGPPPCPRNAHDRPGGERICAAARRPRAGSGQPARDPVGRAQDPGQERHDRPLSRVGRGALASDPPVQDDIVGTMLVWAIDIGDWPLALELGDHVLAANLGLPERYKRSPAVLLAEEIAESALRVATACRAPCSRRRWPSPPTTTCPIRCAKLHKALGLAFQAEAEAFDPEAESQRAGGKRALVDAALDHTSRALVLDQHAGVKKVIERLNADLKKLPEASATP